MVRPPERPTDAELAILNVLWESGPCTVRDVHRALAPLGRRGYTTTLKLMQVMAEKGWVTRDESQRSHLYQAAVSRAATQGSLVQHLQDRAFGGSAARLVLSALSHRPASAEELAEIRRLLDQLETDPSAADDAPGDRS